MKDKKYKPFFLDTHSKFKNIFYDTDFSEIRKHVKELERILKTMDMRQTRSKTLQIAKSVFDYESQQDFYQEYPHIYYDFRFADTRICIACKVYHGKKEYFVNCCGFNPSSRFAPYVGHFGFGSAESIDGVKTLYCEIIREFILGNLGSLF